MKFLITSSLIVVAFLNANSYSQSRAIDESAWMTIATENSEFVLRMPRSSLVQVEDDRQNPRTSLFGFDSGVSIHFSQTKTSSAKEWMKARGVPRDGTVESTFKIGNIDMRTIISNDGMYRLTIVAASKSRYFVLSISGENKDDPAIAYVLSSVRINGTPIVERKDGPPLQEQSVPIELGSLKTSKEITDALKAKRPKWNGNVTYEPLSAFKKSEKIASVRPPIELNSLRPKFNPSFTNSSGLIRFRVVFKADGSVGDMAFYSDVERPIVAAYAAGARELRFLPAIGSDGKPVDFTKEFVMTFETSVFLMINRS